MLDLPLSKQTHNDLMVKALGPEPAGGGFKSWSGHNIVSLEKTLDPQFTGCSLVHVIKLSFVATSSS